MKLEEYLHQYLHSKDLKSRLLAIQYAKENQNPTTLKIILAGLKDSYFKMRIRALDALDLTKPEVAKLALVEVEKIAQSDPKTLVQAKAIGKLAELGNKKYLPIFEKGIQSASYSVQGNSAYGIAKINPENSKSLLEKIDLENANEDLITLLLPTIVNNKMEKHQVAIASTVAFYPFLAFQKPNLGKVSEDGFNWIMDGDNTQAVAKLTKILRQVKSHINDNIQAKSIIYNMLKSGVERKISALKDNPKSENLNKQIELLHQVIEIYK